MKLQPFDEEQRAFLDMIGLGVSEAKFYAAVGHQLPVRSPRPWHAAHDEADGSFVMVLEDLEASGCRFCSAEDADVVAVAESLVDELAALHATFWGQELDWLGTHALPPGDGAEAQERMAMGAMIVQSALDQFATELPAEFRGMGELYIARNSVSGTSAPAARTRTRARPVVPEWASSSSTAHTSASSTSLSHAGVMSSVVAGMPGIAAPYRTVLTPTSTLGATTRALERAGVRAPPRPRLPQVRPPGR